MLKIAVLLVTTGLYLTAVIVLSRYRTDHPSWRELRNTMLEPSKYTARGRQLLPVLYGAAVLWALAVLFILWDV